MASNNDRKSSENESDTLDAYNIKFLKYGDSDLSSKRRKNEDTFDSDKLHTSIDNSTRNDRNNYESFQEMMAFDSDLNSTFLTAATNSNQNDFNSSGSKSALNSIQKTDSHVINSSSELSLSCAKESHFITKSPSGTSCGFENTFRILEKQISLNRKKRSYLRRISEEYVPNLSSLMHDDYDASSSTSLSYNSIESGTNSLDLFELELEAMQRLRQHNSQMEISSTFKSTGTDNNELGATAATVTTQSKDEQITSPINELLYGIHPAIGFSETITVDDETVKQIEKILEGECNYSEYVYHIARGKDGRKYLRVVRNLLLDKVLCGNRVSQMTRAYDDIEAVTRLLEEKEKDLELTVQIGKELLTQNNRLENRISELEAELKSSNEDRAQLLHDLHQKNELIVILTNDADEGGDNAETPTVSKSITLDLLQKKIQSLQDENKSLKQEALQIVKQTDEVEEQERKLMENITVQLNSAHSQFDGLNLELERLKEENRLQHEQIVSLTARLSEAEIRLHQLTAENDEQCSLLSITKENQGMLATELAEFKTRYQEVLALLQEAQEQLRKYRKKTQPQARSSFISGLGVPQPDSLHSELMESSIYSENSLDSGISTDRMSGIMGNLRAPIVQPYKRVFETVQCATKSGHYSDGMSHLGAMALSSCSQPRMTAMPYIPPGIGLSRSQNLPSSNYSGSSLGVKTMSCESLTSQNSEETYPTNQAGVPGVPGAKDLEAALKRLTPAEILARRAMLSHAPAGTYSYEENYNNMPLGIRTPDSIMSTGSSGISNTSSNPWRLPEKLQIVKPMEGSQTLHQWSRLATPNLSGLLEERPGVTTRGGRDLEDLGMQVYSLSDVEEDVEDHPGKQFQSSSCVYTFTNSTVMHPDDGTQPLSFLSQSQVSSRMASASTSRQPSCPPTPRTGLSRRNSCSTFSVNMGLASMLSERGIKAVTPSALNTPLGPNFSPTVTPCNSPEGSPTRSMSPEPLFGILSSGADLIRRKLIGNPEPSVSVRQQQQQQQNKQQKIMLSRLEKRALRSLKLLEKVENIGLENIIATQPSAVCQLGSGIASRSASPMAQLTSLKNLHAINQATSSSVVSSDDAQFYQSHRLNNVNNDFLQKNLGSDLSDDSGNSSLSSMNSNMSIKSSNNSEQQKQNAQTASSISSAQSSIGGDVETASTNLRIRQMQRQKSRRHLKNGMGGQRPDLGTVVGGRVRPDLGVVKSSSGKLIKQATSTTTIANDQVSSSSSSSEKVVTQSMTQSFVGSISSLFFGRKGGWL